METFPTLINTVLAYSKEINNSRTQDSVFRHVVEEVGELAEQLTIATTPGYYKQPGKDGVIGEAIDVILSLVDLIYITNPNITEQQFVDIALNKLEKWRRNENAVL